MTPNRKPTTVIHQLVLHGSLVLSLLLVVFGQLLFSGCQDTSDSGRTQFGTESHFLMACERDIECGELSCVQGVCSLACDDDGECQELVNGSTCGSLASERICVVECDADRDCIEFVADACVAGFCGGLGAPEANGNPSAPSAAITDDPASTTDTPAAVDDEMDSDGTDTASMNAGPSSADDGGPAPSAGEPDAGASSSSEPVSSDGGPQADAGAVMSADGDSRACVTSADCMLAIRVDVCCPECQEAFSATYVAEQECVYGDAEPAPVGCEPADCPGGCPGASCGDTLGAVCAAGTCALEVDASNCGSCDGACVLDASSGLYECAQESCEFDRCHPERCDQIGERCCDPLPGDGANYCNGGLECGLSGCEAPTGVASDRLCGTVLCAEGDVCCDWCTGSCVNEVSGAACLDRAPQVCDSDFECGPEVCNAEVQYCSRMSVGQSPQEFVYDCTTLPDACTSDPTCECWIGSGQYGECSDVDGGGIIVDYLGE